MFYNEFNENFLLENYKPVNTVIDPEFYNFVIEQEKNNPKLTTIINDFDRKGAKDYKFIYCIHAKDYYGTYYSKSVITYLSKIILDFKALTRDDDSWQNTSIISAQYRGKESYILLDNMHFEKAFGLWNLRYVNDRNEAQREYDIEDLVEKGVATRDEIEDDIIPNTQDLINTRIQLYRIIKDYQKAFAEMPPAEKEKAGLKAYDRWNKLYNELLSRMKDPAPKQIAADSNLEVAAEPETEPTPEPTPEPAATEEKPVVQDTTSKEPQEPATKTNNPDNLVDDYIQELARTNAEKTKTTNIEKALDRDAIASMICNNVIISYPVDTNSRSVKIQITKFNNNLPANLRNKIRLDTITNNAQKASLYIDSFIKRLEELEGEKDIQGKEGNFDKKYKPNAAGYTTLPYGINEEELTKWLQKHVTRIDVKIPDPSWTENAAQRKNSERAADMARFEVKKLKELKKAEAEYEPAVAPGSWGTTWIIWLDNKAMQDIPEGVSDWETQKRRTGFSGTTQDNAELAENEKYVYDKVFRVNQTPNGPVYQITGNNVVRDLLMHCPGLRVGKNK